MTFLNPNLLFAGAACVAIPILVHLLLRRRRRPIPWGAMRFLLEAYKQQRRRMKLEQFLLLAARCLLLLLVALAIGRPVLAGIAGMAARAPREVYVFIDNSLASTIQSDPGAAPGGGEAAGLLEKHKKAAADLVRSLDVSRGDRVALVALAGPAEAIVLPPSTDLAAVASLIGNIAPSASSADWEGGAALIAPHAKPIPGQEPPVVAVFSGFRLGAVDTSVDPSARIASPESAGDAAAPGPTLRVVASVPDDAPASNTGVAAVDLLEGVLIGAQSRDQAGGAASIRVRLVRSGRLETAQGVVRAWISRGSELPAENSVGREPLAWSEGEREKTVVVRAPLDAARAPGAGRPLLTVAVDRDAIEGDNVFRRPVAVREQVRAAVVGTPGARATPGDERSILERFGPADWAALALEPREDDPVGGLRAEIAVAWTEPAGVGLLDADRLDAVIVAAPDKVAEADWRTLADLRARGVVVIIVPPRDEKVHLWTDPFRAAFGLDWEMGREAVDFDPPRAMAWEGRPRPARDLLSQIGGEMTELSRAVTVSRMLPIASKTADVQVWAADSRAEAPLVLSAAPASSAPEAPAPGTPQPPGAQPGEASSPRAGAAHGALVVFASSLDLSWTTLPARPLMVPLMQELVRQGVGASSGGRTAVAGGRLAAPGGAAQLRPLENAGAGVLSVAADGLTTNPVRSAGAWIGVDARGATLPRSGLLVSNPDISAGRVAPQPREDVERWLARYAGLPASAAPGAEGGAFRWLEGAGLGGDGADGTPSGSLEALDSTSQGSPWSMPLFIAALLIALAELVMARVFSHARVEASTRTLAPAPGRAAA